jgi:predicted DCC family thiol-disulfide oxidoreductase YuxK
MTQVDIEQQRMILFDGICNLCNASVLFVLEHEREPIFKFASMRSEAGQELLSWCGLPSEYAQAVILIDQGKIDLGSTAALKIGQTLKFPWWFLSYLGFVVPKFVRDWIYNQIAQHRYRWFGKREFCMIPTESLKSRFM